jgi:diguanylate cyclase (GGDEF)-like protein
VSRFGGDEFIILLPDVGHAEDATVCADKVIQAFAAPYEVGGHHLQISASIGIASFPGDASDAETLLRFADIAMYQAKSGGRNKYRVFNSETAAAERVLPVSSA